MAALDARRQSESGSNWNAIVGASPFGARKEVGNEKRPAQCIPPEILATKTVSDIFSNLSATKTAVNRESDEMRVFFGFIALEFGDRSAGVAPTRRPYEVTPSQARRASS